MRIMFSLLMSGRSLKLWVLHSCLLPTIVMLVPADSAIQYTVMEDGIGALLALLLIHKDLLFTHNILMVVELLLAMQI